MKLKRFQEIYEQFMQEEAKLLGIKRQAYIGSDKEDVIANFKQIAAFEGRKPEEVCLTLILKHIQSIQKAVASKRYISPEFVDSTDGTEGFWQRIADARNYLLLLAALIEERSKEEIEEDMKKIPHYEHDFTKVENRPGGAIFRCTMCHKSMFVPHGASLSAGGTIYEVTE